MPSGLGLGLGSGSRFGRCVAPSVPSVVGASFTGRISKEIVCGRPERKMLPVQSLAAKVKASAPCACPRREAHTCEQQARLGPCLLV